MFSRQFPIKHNNSRDHTTIIEGSNLFGPKSSSHVPKKQTPPLKRGHFARCLRRFCYKLLLAFDEFFFKSTLSGLRDLIQEA